MDEVNEDIFDEKPAKSNGKKKIIIVGISILSVVLLIVLVCCIMTIGYKKIYDGVSVNGIKVGGMTVEEAAKVLTRNYENLSYLDVKVICKEYRNDFRGEDIGAAFDSKVAADSAYSYGRDGGLFERIFNGFSLRYGEKDLDIQVTADRKKIDSQISKVTRDIVRDVVQPSYVRESDVLLVKNGVTGITADNDAARVDIIENLTQMRGCEVTVKTETVQPEKVDIDKIQNEIKQVVQNAEYENENGSLIEQKIGVEIKDLDQAKSIAKSITEEGMQFSIPLLITLPDVTTKDVLDDLFRDRISTYTTYYNVNDTERSENVVLAAELIDDIMLMPGQEFSYNTIVGERSTERGFKTAKVYQQGQVVDGLGGGICQVSSTLYNAAVMADLDILERKNHSLPVSYVKLGRDATVAYGTTDFRFKNSRQYPIKIETSAAAGTLVVSVYGYNTNKTRSVDIETETIEVLSYTETEIMDSTMPIGTTKITQEGKKGYKVKSYRVTKENGEVIERKLISTDTYSPSAQIKKIGTKEE